MKNKQLISTFILTALAFSYSWADNSKQRMLDDLKVGIEFGFGAPYEWAMQRNLDTSYKASYNLNLGAHLGYDFYWPTIYKSFKFGPEIGLTYGFTSKWRISSDRSLHEKYLHIPVSLKMLRIIDENEGVNDTIYFALGGSVGYEFNILLSAVYIDQITYTDDGQQTTTDKQTITQLDPSTDLPKVKGNILANVMVYMGKSFYFGSKLRIPIEFLKKDKLEFKLLQNTRRCTTSFLEAYVGLDIMKLIV